MTITESATMPVADDERARAMRHRTAVADDTHRVNVWLAQHWPWDWPQPVLRGRPQLCPPGVRAVSDRCVWSVVAQTPDEFDRYEGVLTEGSTAPVERGQDAWSVHVTRSFGSVDIEVSGPRMGE